MRNRYGTHTTNKEELLNIVEDFYGELYKSRLEHQLHLEGKTTKKINQESEVTPCITLDEIDPALRRMMNNKVLGEDGIAAEVVKLGGRSLMKKIKYLFSISLHNNSIATKWNNAVTIPIHNKGDKTDFENYRSISLLKHLYKLLTRITTTRPENSQERRLGFIKILEEMITYKQFNC